MTIAIRTALSTDRRFVAASWTASMKDSYTAGLIQWDDYHRLMFPQYEKAMRREGVSTLIAYETSEDPTADIYGYIVFDSSTQHEPLEDGGFRTWPAMVFYVYVKEAYRRAGIARRLFAAAHIDPLAPFAYACSTAVVSDLESKIPSAKWRPLLARRPKIVTTRRSA